MKISHMLAAAGLAVAAIGTSTGAIAQNYYGGDRWHDSDRHNDYRRDVRYDREDRYDRYDHDRRWYGRHHHRYERCHTEWRWHHQVEVCR